MNQKLVNLIIGSLLHDVGKIIYRSGEKKSHSILGWEFLSKIPAFEGNTDIKECIKYHHGRELSKAALDDNSLAYIAYVADNISAYSDRRLELIEGDSDSEAGFDKTAPLASVFNILNGSNNNLNYKLKFLKDINYPTSNEISATASNYLDIKIKLEEQLKGVQVEEKYINSILHLLEICTSYVPSSTNTKELGDISLYDHSKTTASIASCLFYYLEGENLKEKIFKDEKALKDEKAFLLFSFDVSGIQNYIYTISGKGALKALRARSLYLDLLMENIVDDLLQKTNLSRCNLIYAGGGHAYILLPNTKATIDSLIEFEQELKSWFLSEFGVALYVACAYVDCTGNELAQDIGSVYERVGRELSIKKSQRYTYDDIVKLNTSTREKNDRECRECKKSGPLSQDGMCNICQALIDISPSIVQKGLYFVVEKNKSDYSLPLPFGNNLYFKTLNEAQKSDYIRVYSKNEPSMGIDFATNIWVGDYHFNKKEDNNPLTFEYLADNAKGINRICILRADVDNLGRAFTQGFKEQKDGVVVTNSDRKYETISRTATLSRHLSMFFKYYINQILSEKQYKAQIVYSGGDDMFIVGSWNDVIDMAKDINTAFEKYSQKTLTISAGIGIYNSTYPIARIASEVGSLESAAKNKDIKKNKVCLFHKGKKDEKGNFEIEDWVLNWGELPYINQKIDNAAGIQHKLNTLRFTFNNDKEKGKALLYKMLELLRSSNSDRINIARYAYLLKRAEKDSPNINASTFYKWIQTDNDIKELEIAITIYVYETRENQ